MSSSIRLTDATPFSGTCAPAASRDPTTNAARLAARVSLARRFIVWIPSSKLPVRVGLTFHSGYFENAAAQDSAEANCCKRILSFRYT